MAGMVYLVGAGPGDYRLISIKAVDCLKQADVVVYDRLADDRILQWAPDEAEYIYVGKASSNHTMKQEDINQLLVDLGPELGQKRSSAQITQQYAPEDLVGKQVLAVLNFPPRQIGPVMSEVLVLGLPDENNQVVLIGPDKPVPIGGRMY